MFDIGFVEILTVGIIALLVIGPERLPHAARVAGKWIARIKQTVGSLKDEIEREVAADELKNVMKREMEESGISDISKELEKSHLIGAESLRDAAMGANEVVDTVNDGIKSTNSSGGDQQVGK